MQIEPIAQQAAGLDNFAIGHVPRRRIVSGEHAGLVEDLDNPPHEAQRLHAHIIARMNLARDAKQFGTGPIGAPHGVVADDALLRQEIQQPVAGAGGHAKTG